MKLLPLLLLFALPAIANAQFSYTTNNGTLTVTGYNGSEENVVIPGSVGGMPVVGLGDLVFINSFVTNVVVPASATNWGSGVFYTCNYLLNVNIPDGVQAIPDNTFGSDYSLSSVIIPSSVASIGVAAFDACFGLTNLAIPAAVTNLDTSAFHSCTHMTDITVDPANPVFTSIAGVVFDKSAMTLLVCPHGRTGSYAIPDGVKDIAADAFDSGSELGPVSLSAITVPTSVTNLESGAFARCVNLTALYFMGNAPATADGYVFFEDSATVYYLPGTTGWSASYDGLPTALWLPQVQTADGSFGFKSNGFGFNINWASGHTVVVQACTNLGNPAWQNLQTNTLAGNSAYFSDLQWTNYPAKFYRLASP